MGAEHRSHRNLEMVSVNCWKRNRLEENDNTSANENERNQLT
jgi:hypothetical protein